MRYLNGDLNSGPFDDQTVVDHSNTGRVSYSDPHCISNIQFVGNYLLGI